MMQSPQGTSPRVTAGQCERTSRSVLIVDDEPGVRHLMRRWLESRGYHVAVASGADTALELMAASPTAVALCDLRMPGHDGFWLTDRLRREHPETAVIIATGVTEQGPSFDGLRQSVVDYLTKPFERDRLCEAVSRGLEWHVSACDGRRWREFLEQEMRERYTRYAEIVASHYVSSDDALDGLMATLTVTRPDAYGHAHRVADLSAAVARRLGFTQSEIATVARGAFVHDIGKLALPDALLQKPAALTIDEQRLVRLHPRLGSGLIVGVPYLASAALVVRDAHERVDGLGYPEGKRGDEVWLGARIVTAADAYDAMTRSRVFRDPLPARAALEELERCAGTQFDRRVVDALTHMLN
jgi:response regulator RpfG family c-di-GMP phosphodiesterase